MALAESTTVYRTFDGKHRGWRRRGRTTAGDDDEDVDGVNDARADRR